jgi:hypothetical protein
MTNMGLSINLPIKQLDMSVLAALRCWFPVDGGFKRIQIHLRPIQRSLPETSGPYRREQCDKFELVSPSHSKGTRWDIYVLEEEQIDLIELIDCLYTSNPEDGKETGDGGALIDFEEAARPLPRRPA